SNNAAGNGNSSFNMQVVGRVTNTNVFRYIPNGTYSANLTLEIDQHQKDYNYTGGSFGGSTAQSWWWQFVVSPMVGGQIMIGASSVQPGLVPGTTASHQAKACIFTNNGGYSIRLN